jgi:hypothetical protein
MYYYCNVLYSSEFKILVYKVPKDGGISPKLVGVKKRLHCCVR